MSLEDGYAAINLEMPARVPRYELSVDDYHYALMREVTGVEVRRESDDRTKRKAQSEFVRAWNYDIYCTGGDSAGDAISTKYTNMGHANYAEQGADFDDDIRCPFDGPEDVFSFDPWETYGAKDHRDLVSSFNDSYNDRRRLFPDAVNTAGVYHTLMSGMIAIFGWELLLQAAALSLEKFGDTVNRYATWMQQYYDAVAESETPVVYSHDDLVWTEGPFIHPDWYRKYIFPNLKRLWEPARQAGKKVLFQCDGNYTMFAGDIAAAGNSGFWFEIFTDLEYVAQKYGDTHFIIGNADCRILTFGRKEDIRAEVERCLDIGKRCPGYFMCVSGHIPPNVPVENALYYNEVYNELMWR